MGDFNSESFRAVMDGFMNVNNLYIYKSHILKQTCQNFQVQVCLSMYDLLVNTRP